MDYGTKYFHRKVPESKNSKTTNNSASKHCMKV